MSGSTKRTASGKGKKNSVDLRDLPAIDSARALDQSPTSQGLGYDNKSPGKEGLGSTYVPYDNKDVYRVHKTDVEALIPKFRNLSDAVMGHLISLGIDGRNLGQNWGANFDKMGSIRSNRQHWGHPYLTGSGQLYVVVDYPLCGSHNPREYIDKHGFKFLENSSIPARVDDAERRNVFLQEYERNGPLINRSSAPQASERLNAGSKKSRFLQEQVDILQRKNKRHVDTFNNVLAELETIDFADNSGQAIIDMIKNHIGDGKDSDAS